MSGVIEITDSQFEQEVFGTDETVFVYFWASWCGPCRLVSPSINWVAQTYGDRMKVVKLEVDPNPQAVAKCGVEGVPAIRIVKNKEIIVSFEGAIAKPKLQQLIDDHI